MTGREIQDAAAIFMSQDDGYGCGFVYWQYLSVNDDGYNAKRRAYLSDPKVALAMKRLRGPCFT